MLKLSGGNYYFPKRQRFNEDHSEEIQSQRAFKHQANLNRLLGNTEGQPGKKMTSEELSKYFNNKTSPEELRSIITARMSKAASNQGSGKSRFTRRIVDCGNRRYAASQASTYCGGLITGLHFKKTIKVPTEDAEKTAKNTIEVNKDATEKTADETAENQ